MPRPYQTLSSIMDMPRPSNTADEEKMRNLLFGKSMIPYEYADQPGVVHRDMRPSEVDALMAQGQQGLQPEVLPTSLLDLVMNPVNSFLDEADLSKYLVPAMLLGMVRRRAVAPRPGVQRAEEILKGLDPAEEKMLYHSGTADIDESIRQNWLQPQVGGWVSEVLHGAVDDPDLINELSQPGRGVVYMSDVPEWVRAKVARKAGKHVQDVTMDDIRKHGQLTMIQTSKDAPVVRKLEDDDYVQNLRGEKQRWWESPGYDYETRRDVPFGVEPGDYFAVEDIKPTHTLTGADLIQFLQRNHPETLSSLTKGRAKKK